MLAPVVKAVACGAIGFALATVVSKEAACKEAVAVSNDAEGRASQVNSYNQELLDQNRELLEENRELKEKSELDAAEKARLRQQLQEMTQQRLELQARLERMAKDNEAARKGVSAASTSTASSISAGTQKKSAGAGSRIRGIFG